MNESWRPDPGDFACPECGAPTERGDWWDDPPEDGGAIIGYKLRCTRCDWSESY